MRKDPNNAEKSEIRALMLNREEEELCRRIGLSFPQYIIMKEGILREAVRLGALSKEYVFKMFRLEPELTEQVFDFLVQEEEIIV